MHPLTKPLLKLPPCGCSATKCGFIENLFPRKESFKTMLFHNGRIENIIAVFEIQFLR